MLTLRPSLLSTATSGIWDYQDYLALAIHIMACLDILFLYDLLPSWLKRFVAIPSNSDQPSTSSSRNTSLLGEGSGSPVSCGSPVNSLTGYVPGITVLPSPSPACLSTTPKPAVHEYRAYEPPPFHQTLPLEPLIISIHTSGHIAGRSMNGSPQYPTFLWYSILIQ